MIVMGIETACDDTAVAVVEDGTKILSNVLYTQERVHQKFGGVVPELAARRHTEVISFVVQEALDKAGISFKQINAVGVNCQHGLLRSIVVGVAAAKAIAYVNSIPLIGVHHIESHIYSNIINNPNIAFPHICLTVSGGHNLLIEVTDHNRYKLIGRTLDDSAGEAFDKVAKLLDLGFPGGPIIDKLSRQGDQDAFPFPRPMLDSPDYNFSFSGLKTAVVNTVKSLGDKNKQFKVADIAASFQKAVVDVLLAKTIRAARDHNISTISLAGGVAANSRLRDEFLISARKNSVDVLFPEISLCTDNGATVATLAYYRYKQGFESDIDLDVRANAPMGELDLVYKISLK